MSLRFLPVWQKWHWKLGLKSTLVDITQRAAIFENLQPCFIGAALKGPIMWLPSLEEWCFWLIEIWWPNLMSVSLIVHRSVESGWLTAVTLFLDRGPVLLLPPPDGHRGGQRVGDEALRGPGGLSLHGVLGNRPWRKQGEPQESEGEMERVKERHPNCLLWNLTAKEIPNEQIHHLNICAI